MRGAKDVGERGLPRFSRIYKWMTRVCLEFLANSKQTLLSQTNVRPQAEFQIGAKPNDTTNNCIHLDCWAYDKFVFLSAARVFLCIILAHYL